MDAYNYLKDEILKVNQDVLTLISKAKSMPGMAETSFADWEKTCRAVPDQMAEDIMRVAVVGPIKSGKSTFLNSMLEGDYLKRGAGVVTSIVTRVRSGDRLSAHLFFKSWDEVNAEIEQALHSIPANDREVWVQVGMAIKADQLLAMKKEEGRELIADKRLVYIYHDEIHKLIKKVKS